jgi:hypothetical protein
MDIICTGGEFQSKTEGYVNWGTFSAVEKGSSGHLFRRLALEESNRTEGILVMPGRRAGHLRLRGP